MADKYWVGTSTTNRSGTWSTTGTTVWSADYGATKGAPVPTTADDLTFPDYGGNYTVTLSGALNCNSLQPANWSGTVTFSGTGTLSFYWFIDLSYTPVVWSATGTISARGADPTLYNYNTVSLPSFLVNCTGSFGLNGNMLSRGTFTLTQGYFYTNGYNLTCTSFNSSGTAVRAVDHYYGGIVYCPSSINCSVATNCTFINHYDEWTQSGFVINTTANKSAVVGSNSATMTGFPVNYVGPRVYLIGSGTWSGGGFFDILDMSAATGAPLTTTALVYNFYVRGIWCGTGTSYQAISLTMIMGGGFISANGRTLGKLIINCQDDGWFALVSNVLFYATTVTVPQLRGGVNLNSYTITCNSWLSNALTTARAIYFQDGGNIVLTNTTTNGTSIAMNNLTNFVCSGDGSFVQAVTNNKIYDVGSASGGVGDGVNLRVTGGSATISINLVSGSYFRVLNLSGWNGIFGTTTNPTLYISESYVTRDVFGSTPNWTVPTIITQARDGVDCTLWFRGYNQSGWLNYPNYLKINNSPTGHTSILNMPVNMTTGIELEQGEFTVGMPDSTQAGWFSINQLWSNSSKVRKINFLGDSYLYVGGGGVNIANASNFTVYEEYAGSGGIKMSSGYTFGTTAAPVSAPSVVASPGFSIANNSYVGQLNISALTSALNVGGSNAGKLYVNGLNLPATLNQGFGAVVKGSGTIGSTSGTGRVNYLEIVNPSGTNTLTSNFKTLSFKLSEGLFRLAGYDLETPSITLDTSGVKSIEGSGNFTSVTSVSAAANSNMSRTGTPYTIKMFNGTINCLGPSPAQLDIIEQTGSGTLTINGSGDYLDIVTSTRPSTIKFETGTTHTVQGFTLSGTLGNKVTISSTIPGTQFNLSDSGGSVTASYLNIQDSNATGGATWDASNGTNTNLGNNSGWLFGAPGGGVNGQFMVFF